MEEKKFTFTAILLQEKITATGIAVPEEIITGLALGKRPPVKVTLNNFTYPSTIAVMGGTYMIPVSAAVREQSGVKAGDILEVTVEADSQPRTVELPEDFQAALRTSQAAFDFFEKLSPSSKKKYVLNINEAKTEETRNRRIQ